jgi:hypothetical protein
LEVKGDSRGASLLRRQNDIYQAMFICCEKLVAIGRRALNAKRHIENNTRTLWFPLDRRLGTVHDFVTESQEITFTALGAALDLWHLLPRCAESYAHSHIRAYVRMWECRASFTWLVRAPREAAETNTCYDGIPGIPYLARL